MSAMGDYFIEMAENIDRALGGDGRFAGEGQWEDVSELAMHLHEVMQRHYSYGVIEGAREGLLVFD
jgi:hypothetical protein